MQYESVTDGLPYLRFRLVCWFGSVAIENARFFGKGPSVVVVNFPTDPEATGRS